MRLSKAQVSNYRSIRDTGWFDVENMKTIMVGSNEAGKTAVLQALQQINAPKDVPKFEALRDYPRSSYNDITIGKVDPSQIVVVEAHFSLDQEDKDLLPDGFKDCTYYRATKLDNGTIHNLYGAPKVPTYSALKKDLQRLSAHLDARIPAATDGSAIAKPSEGLSTLTAQWKDSTPVAGENAKALTGWLEKNYHHIDEKNTDEEARYDQLVSEEIRTIWNPNLEHHEANKLRVNADGQYLKVVVEDDLGVEIELDQRSEGFQWLVSFFVVLFAEAIDKHANAILLLDEPGLSLHGLKQREFRTTLRQRQDIKVSTKL